MKLLSVNPLRSGGIVRTLFGLINLLVSLLLPYTGIAFPVLSQPLTHLGTFGQVAIAGDIAYVGTSYGISTFNIQDPANPALIGQYLSPSYSRLKVQDEKLYALGAYLTEFDIADPAHLRVNQTRAISSAYNFAIHGDLIGLTTGYYRDDWQRLDAGVSFYNLANFQQDKGGLSENYWYYCLDFDQNYLYTGCGDRIEVWNISNLDSVARLNSFAGGCLDLRLNAGTLYQLPFDRPVTAWNLDDPVHPVQVGVLQDTTHLYSFAIQGSYLFGAADSSLRIYDIAHPNALTRTANLSLDHHVESVEVGGNVAAVHDDNRIDFIDVSDKSNPTLLSHIESYGVNRSIVAQDSIVIVAAAKGGVYVYSTEHPESPELIKHIVTPYRVEEALLVGNFALIRRQYTGNDQNDLTLILDISEPSQPDVVAELPYATSMAIYDTTLFLATTSQLLLYDISSLTEPHRITRYTLDIHHFDLNFPNLIAHLSDGRLAVFNLNNLNAAPTYVLAQSPLQFHDGIVVGNLWIQSYFDDIGGFPRKLEYYSDITNLHHPMIIDSVETARTYFSVGPYVGIGDRVYDYGEYLTTRLCYEVSSFESMFPTFQSVLVDSILYAIDEQAMTVYDLHDYLAVREPIPQRPPTTLSLSAYPNPFNASTKISYSLPVSGRYALSVVDLTGRLVLDLGEGWREAGNYQEVLDAQRLPSGAHFVRLQLENSSATSPITILK